MKENFYLCIDLKSFFASVECVERGLDSMNTNLVVADPERTDKTICLAVSPSLKKLGVKNRCRMFEIPKNLDYIVANGNIDDNKVLMGAPFQSVGSITSLFKDDMGTAKQIMEVVAQIKRNSEEIA